MQNARNVVVLCSLILALAVLHQRAGRVVFVVLVSMECLRDRPWASVQAGVRLQRCREERCV